VTQQFSADFLIIGAGAAAFSRNLIGAGGGANATLAGLAPLVSPARFVDVIATLL
jgi:hypothetical protein